MRILFFLCSFALVLTGCTEKHAPEAAPAPQAAPAPEVEDGIQVVKIAVGNLGYKPSRIALQAGIPARLVFTRTSSSGCTEEVHIPDFYIARTFLPMNEPVAIEFTPTEPGTYTFACGMKMLKGTLVVKT